MGIRNVIAAYLRQFVQDSDDAGALSDAVARHQFLPLYLGWNAVLGIRADGVLVRWDWDSSNDSIEPVQQAYWQRMALAQGSKRYPELMSLIPRRPDAAETCRQCGGTGALAGAEHLICDCGGAGWVVPGESREGTPG